MTERYKVLKSLNNNVVVTEKDNNLYILSGKGIGFGKKKNDIISNRRSIEQKFIQIDEKEQYKSILDNVDEKVLSVVEEVIDMVSEKLGYKLNSHVHIALSDHIDFSIKRIKQGINIVNPFLFEIKILYPKEYAIGQKTLKIIREKLGVELPESEAGFIALHIYSAKTNKEVSESVKFTRAFKEILDFISEKLDIDFNEKSLEYSRLIAHLRYAVYRIENEKSLENMFLPSVKKQLKKEFKISKEICEFISKKIKKDVPEDEVGYIAVHIHRLIE